MSQLSVQISVVIPLYNKANHILDTLDSIFRQTKAAHEIIVVDDGSTDGSAEKVESLSGKNVRLIRQKNAGVSAARNLGISVATTEYVALIDADDQWEVHFLQEMELLIQQFQEAGVYSCAYQYRSGPADYFAPKVSRRYLPRTPGLIKDFFKAMGQGDLPVTMSSVVLRRSLFESLGGFPLGEPMGEDQDFLFRAAFACPIAYDPKVLAFYHLDSDNRACVRHVPKTECPFSQRLGMLALRTEMPDWQRHDIETCRAAHVLHLARRNLQAGDISAARQLLIHPVCAAKPVSRVMLAIKVSILRVLKRVADLFALDVSAVKLKH